MQVSLISQSFLLLFISLTSLQDVFTVILSPAQSCSISTVAQISWHYYAVKKIVDGDTFWIDDGSEKGIKIRLTGIDAPESRNSFNKVVGYYGKESKIYLKKLLQGKRVRLEFDVDAVDRYGRTLAYVYLADGTFVNADLVKNGYAYAMTVPPNVKYSDQFVQLQQQAREAGLGLWK